VTKVKVICRRFQFTKWHCSVLFSKSKKKNACHFLSLARTAPLPHFSRFQACPPCPLWKNFPSVTSTLPLSSSFFNTTPTPSLSFSLSLSSPLLWILDSLHNLVSVWLCFVLCWSHSFITVHVFVHPSQHLVPCYCSFSLAPYCSISSF